jgi:glycosyltransferase involved in cell wall biosynthesis
MSVLFLADASPLPPTTGARERDLQLARVLGRSMDVAVATLGPVPGSEREPFRLVSAGDPPSRVLALLTSITTAYQVTRHTSDSLRRLAADGTWDAIHASHVFTAPIGLHAHRPMVIDAHNVETTVARTSAGMTSNRIRRGRLRWEAAKIERLERHVIPRADAVLATSDHDAEILERWGARRVLIVPNGVDCANVARHRPVSGCHAVVFVGSYDYVPNATAAAELVERVMPILRERVADATLTLVGRHPPAHLARQELPWLTVTGEVPEVDSILEAARVTVLPIRGGGGTRLKALGALAAGVPVVSTPFGVAGLGLVPDRHVLLGESSADLSEQAARILTDDRLAARLSQEGRREVERRFDWSAVTAPLASLYEDLIGDRER